MSPVLWRQTELSRSVLLPEVLMILCRLCLASFSVDFVS